MNDSFAASLESEDSDSKREVRLEAEQSFDTQKADISG